MSQLMNPNLGYGGVMTLDAGNHDRAAQLMVRLHENRVGYLAVRLRLLQDAGQRAEFQHIILDSSRRAPRHGPH
jgi:hypothetical protein